MANPDWTDPMDWEDEPEDEDEFFDCSMGPDGYCGEAGSEWCEFECPFRARQRSAG